MSKYLTHPHNFVGRFNEKMYTPDAKLVETLHAYLDMVAITNEKLAMAIDMVVADLMRVEGYGQPERYRELSDVEIMPPKTRSN